MNKRELGEILREADLITEAQLAQALNLQRVYGERLASVLVRQRVLTEKFAVTYLGRQVGVPAVDLSKQDIDLGLLDLVPLRLCERHVAFPVKVEGTRLQIAMADPTDQLLVSEIEAKTGVRLQPMIALEAAIKNAILEARRALRDGRRRITPQVQRHRDADEAPTPHTPFPAAALSPAAAPRPAAAPVAPLPVADLTGDEATVVESLAGAPLGEAADKPPLRTPKQRPWVLEDAPPQAPPARTPRPEPRPEPRPAESAPRPLSPPTAPAAPAMLRPSSPPEPAATTPAPPAPLPAPVAPPEPAAEQSEPRPTVLVVDDDDLILQFASQLLDGAGLHTLTARSGREALARLREAPPDLVVLDGLLPELHGFEVCRQIKNSPRYKHIPVILVSGIHRGWRFAADARERYGADDFLEKPLEPFDMLRRIQTLLKRAPQTPPEMESEVRSQMRAGFSALKQGDTDAALRAFARGLEASPTDEMLHYYLGMTYEKKGQLFQAIDHYEQAVERNTQFYDAIVALAQLYEQQQFRRKAVELWELALRATSDEAVRQRLKQHLLSLL